MRLARIVSAFVALALIGFLPFASAPADATQQGATSHSSSSAVSGRKVTVGARIIKRRDGLHMIGQVRPKVGPIVISKATRCNKNTKVCNFRKYRVAHLKNGGYDVKVIAPRRGDLYWQARVGRNKSSIWVTCKTLSGSCI